MTKQEIRKYYLSKRSSLSQSEVKHASTKINQLIVNELTLDIESIHLFIPIDNSNEINTWKLIQYCWQNHIKTATSITRFNPKRLEHSWFDKNTIFKPGTYNVPEPSPILTADLNEINLVIVPLLCIDYQGNRIGYGQGFYDSFLSQLPDSTLKIGVSLFDIYQKEISPDPWDVQLDGVITPLGKTMF